MRKDLQAQIRGCFKRTHMQTEGDTELFDTEETIKQLEALITEQVRLGSSRDGRGDPATPKTDEYGNPIIWLNRYEAEHVKALMDNLRQRKVQGYDTGDWWLDVPRKIGKWLDELEGRRNTSLPTTDTTLLEGDL